MKRYPSSGDPVGLFLLACDFQKMWMASGQTIWSRMAQALMGSMTQNEWTSMWAEKQVAFTQSWAQAAGASMTGKPTLNVMHAALAPVSKKAVANASRLRSKRQRRGSGAQS